MARLVPTSYAIEGLRQALLYPRLEGFGVDMAVLLSSAAVTVGLLLVQDGPTLYQWSNFRAEGTVGAREAWMRLPPTELRPETGRAGSGIETVSGTFACGGSAA